MTRRQAWLPYIRDLADGLRLRDWQIEIREEMPAESCALATVNPIEGCQCAVLRFSENFLTGSSDEQRYVIVHELIHCHFAVFQRSLESANKAEAPLPILLEYAIDALADGIAPLLPLPPKSVSKGLAR
jgi:hypothetical protein